MELLSHSAEAKIFKDGNCILKQRLPKKYRHAELDKKLRQFRTRREAKILQKLEKHHLLAPKLIECNDKDMTISMEFIEAPQVRDQFDLDYQTIAPLIGKALAQLHNLDIIHGDVTTANMLYKEKLYLIDFGLAQFSEKIEDKAVDLHLLEASIEAQHHTIYPKAFDLALQAYQEVAADADDILKRLEVVKARGRHKHK